MAVTGNSADCTNWGIGRPARLVARVNVNVANCTNWGIGRPARLVSQLGPVLFELYQLGNWKAGKTLMPL